MRGVTRSAELAALLLAVAIGLYVSSDTIHAQAQSVDTESTLAMVKNGICEVDGTFALAIHGGAVFSRSNQGRKVAFVQQALSEARALLASGARAIDVVEAVIAGMENSGVFNAGKGANANQAGVIEMDASIMEGRWLKAGAVAAVRSVRNPISAARLVMEKSRHVMMVGSGADAFVRDNRGAVADPDYFLHSGANFDDVPLPGDIRIVPPVDSVGPDKSVYSGFWLGVWEGSVNHVLVVEEIGPDAARVIYGLGPGNPQGKSFAGRIDAIFVDEGLQVRTPLEWGSWNVTFRWNPDGTLTATASKEPGTESYETIFRRIGESGADDGGTVGAVARDRCGDLAAGTSTGGFGSKTAGRVGDSPLIGAGTYAISATGHGEFFMRHVVAHAIAAAMKYKGLSLEEAATDLIKYELFRKGLRGGVIAVDRDGHVATPYNTEGMVRGVTSNDLDPIAEAY